MVQVWVDEDPQDFPCHLAGEMDPVTVVGAVASVFQLAQAALSLSKTLYSFGTAIASASGDIQALADDLKTVAQSLTPLSRLLEDRKTWDPAEID